MIKGTYKAVALLMVGLTLGGSMTVALAQTKKTQKTKKPPVTTKPTAAMIAAGAKVYEANGCGGCHMINGKGGTNGPDLSATGADPKHTAKWLETQITSPKTNKSDSTMPPYDSIKGKDLSNLVAYLSSLKKAAPAKPASP
ncbi:MAG: cytochrome b/b6 [Chthonomonadaceae bacterium]|nr:cytochrome b/b6 [Chthonomonadaceae bacterium]